MRDEKITCDACAADLTVRTNSVDYRLVLGSESKPGYGPGAYTDMMIYPPTDRTYHFCGLECLDKWSDRRRHVNKLWKAFMEVWKLEKGTKEHAWFSYPEVPRDIREAKNAEFEAASLVVFP